MSGCLLEKKACFPYRPFKQDPGVGEWTETLLLQMSFDPKKPHEEERFEMSSNFYLKHALLCDQKDGGLQP